VSRPVPRPFASGAVLMGGTSTMADRDLRLLLVLLHLCGVERGVVGGGRLGTLLGPEGTGESLLLQATKVVEAPYGGCRGWLLPGGRGGGCGSR
jgi:hypothetical protein